MQTLSSAESLILKVKSVTCLSIPENIWNLSHQIFYVKKFSNTIHDFAKFRVWLWNRCENQNFKFARTLHLFQKNKSDYQPGLNLKKLVADIDPKDTHYVAYSKHLRCKIWSGDKVLMNGLSKKGITNFITIDELFKWRQNKEEKG